MNKNDICISADFNQVSGHKLIIKNLLNSVQAKSLADKILFSGPSGVGKTTIAICLLNAYSCENYDFNNKSTCKYCKWCLSQKTINHFNCTDFNLNKHGLQKLDYLINFPFAWSPSFPIKPLNIFEEVHTWSSVDQNKLLRILEKKRDRSLSIFTTTDIDKLIVPFRERMSRYNFNRLSKKTLEKIILRECSKYSFNIDPQDLSKIICVSSGDARNALHTLPKFINSRREFPNKDAYEILRYF